MDSRQCYVNPIKIANKDLNIIAGKIIMFTPDTLLQIIGVLFTLLSVSKIRENKLLAVPILIILGWFIHMRFFPQVEILNYFPPIILLLFLGIVYFRKPHKKDEENKPPDNKIKNDSRNFFLKFFQSLEENKPAKVIIVFKVIGKISEENAMKSDLLYLSITEFIDVLKKQILIWIVNYKKGENRKSILVISAAIILLANISIRLGKHQDVLKFYDKKLEEVLLGIENIDFIRGAISRARKNIRDMEPNYDYYFKH